MFGVVSVNRDGSLSKAPLNAHSKAPSMEAAESIKVRFEKLNPGRQFKIVPISSGISAQAQRIDRYLRQRWIGPRR